MGGTSVFICVTFVLIVAVVGGPISVSTSLGLHWRLLVVTRLMSISVIRITRFILGWGALIKMEIVS